ncbi:hypothetical protein OG203_06570 [Nocardia sp. NBC_01499]|uniref:alpha/beta hydrolase family protein n=1 Tax=Nocardia sp. NBC_01499 TaxID=2903597 RepID=UPI00386B31FE
MHDRRGMPTTGWTPAPSHGHLGADADPAGGPRPVLLYSPGAGVPRALGTVQAEDLASHGYIVVSVDAFDTDAVQYPGGRVALPPIPDPNLSREQLLDLLLSIRLADTRFVLDRLVDIAAGHDPDVSGTPLPANLTRMMDLSRIGMFGHSLGGATTVAAMHEDSRIRAGVNLDGPVMGTVAADGLSQPVVLLGSDVHRRREDDPTWQQFRTTGGGLKLQFWLAGSEHSSFTDLQVIAPALVAAGLWKPEDVQAWGLAGIGTIDPNDSVAVQRGFLRTFFDAALDNHTDLAVAPEELLHPGLIPMP